MKNFIRMGFLLITMIVLAVSFASASGEKEALSEKPEGPVELSIGFWDLKSVDDPMGSYIEEKLDIKIEPVAWAWGQHRDQLSLLAASGDLPDIWGTYSLNTLELSRFYNWIDEGLIRAVPEDMIEDYPLVEKLYDSVATDDIVKELKGGYYMIPRPESMEIELKARWKNFYYRKDWMKNVGIEKVPETVDEFYEMLKAFTYDDPDGNGVDDTYGLTIDQQASSYDLFGMFGIDLDSWVKEDGQWIPAYISEKNIPPLSYMQKLYEERILDREFPSNNWRQATQKFVTNSFGVLQRNTDARSIVAVIKNTFGPANPDIEDPLDAVGILPPLKMDEHTEPMWPKFVPIGTTEINAEVQDYKLRKVMELYEFLLTKEGQMLTTYGFEGEDYTVDDDGMVEKKKNPDGSNIILIKKYPTKALGALPAWTGKDINAQLIPGHPENEYRELAKWRRDVFNDAVLDANTTVRFISTPAKDEFATSYGDDFTQMILGDEPVETAFPEYVRKLYARGLDQVIKETNAKAKEMGIE